MRTSSVRPTISSAGTRPAAGSVARKGQSEVTVSANIATTTRNKSFTVSPGTMEKPQVRELQLWCPGQNICLSRWGDQRLATCLDDRHDRDIYHRLYCLHLHMRLLSWLEAGAETTYYYKSLPRPNIMTLLVGIWWHPSTFMILSDSPQYYQDLTRPKNFFKIFGKNILKSIFV